MKKPKINEVLLAPLITLIVLFVVFAVKRIYPFGSLTIDQYGMSEAQLPMYAHTWDVLHGKASLYYDLLTGAGSDLYMSLGFYLASPLNLFFLFVGRDRLLESMSLFLALKLMLAAASQAYYMKKTYGTSFVQNTAAALFYSFCGYMVQHYSNIFYLDTVIMFPLVMHSLHLLIKERKGFLYLFLTWLMLITNPYLGAMVLVFIVFYVFGYIWFFEEKDERKRITAQLGQYTLIALLVSMVVICPAVFKWLRSARMELLARVSYTDLLRSSSIDTQGSKLFMLCGSEIGFAAFLAACSKIKMMNKRETRSLSFHIYLIVLLLLPIAIDSIGYLWNMGTDTGIPLRCAFMLTFVLLDFFGYSSADGQFSIEVKNNQERLVVFTSVIMAVLSLFMFLLLYQHAETGVFNRTGKLLFLPLFASSVLFCCLIAGIKNKKGANIALLIFAVLHSTALCIDFIVPLGTDNIVTSEYFDSLAMKKAFELPQDNLSRVKVTYPDIYANYPLVMGTAGISTKTNEASKEYVNQMAAMGYTTYCERVSDTGGTVFSDALMNVKYVISQNELEPAFYEKAGESGSYKLYKCKFTLPFGMILPQKFLNTSFAKKGLDNQNLIYGAMWNFVDPLFKVYNNDDILKNENTKVTNNADKTLFSFDLDVKGRQTLYMNALEGMEYFSYEVTVNDRSKVITYSDIDSAYTYPSVYNNGIVELGTFTDETVRVNILTNDIELSGLRLAAMDHLKLKALERRYRESCADTAEASKNKIHLTAASGSGLMLIPVEYSENWKGEINGQPTDVFPVMNGAFMGVHVDGENLDIKLTYIPVQLYAGIIVSLIGLLFVFWSYVRIKENLDWANAKILRFIAYPLFNLTAAVFFVIMYIIPTGAYILRLLRIL